MKYEFSTEELLTALQNGTNPDEIAKAFSDALNGAMKAKEAEDKKNLASAKRVNAIDEIIDAIEDFVQTYYPDLYDKKVFDGIDAEQLDKAIADAVEEAKQVERMFKKILNENKNTVDMKKVVYRKPDADTTIASFLSKHGL